MEPGKVSATFPATKLLISGLIKDQSYQFAVAAHNKAGMGNKSATLPASRACTSPSL